MTKNLIKNRSWKAQEYVEKHLPIVVSHQAEDLASIDQRSTVMMQAYKAEMSGEGYRGMYLCRHYLPAAIKLSEENLGYMDNFIVLMRLKLAQRNIKKECARPMLETLLREVTEYVSEPDITLETKHPHYVSLQKEWLVGIINDSLTFADRFAALKVDDEADGGVSYEEECTSACSHHLDFPDRPHHASRPYLTEKERDADKSDTSEKWRWKIYETNRSM